MIIYDFNLHSLKTWSVFFVDDIINCIVDLFTLKHMKWKHVVPINLLDWLIDRLMHVLLSMHYY